MGGDDGVPPERLRRAEPHDAVGRGLLHLGLLPALGGSIAELGRSGQDSRLLDGYLSRYVRAFDRVTYFSYAPERLTDYTQDPVLLAGVDLRAPDRHQPRLLRAVMMVAAERHALRRSAVLRVFQVTGVIPALVARAVWGIPYVTTYGFWYVRLSRSGPSRLAKRVLERVALRRAAAVIVPTAELGQHVASCGAAADRIHLIPNGVDTARFTPAASPRASGPRRILYIGRLEPEKNLATLLSAAAKLTPRWPLEVGFVGAGSLETALRRQAAGLGVTAEFVGVVDHRAIPDRLRRADAFVLPSFTEGHSKVLVEAMAAGLPCLASDCAGNRALVKDGETGLLFDPRSDDTLAAGLERVLGDPALAEALGRRARERVVRELDLGDLVEREIALLRAVARGARS